MSPSRMSINRPEVYHVHADLGRKTIKKAANKLETERLIRFIGRYVVSAQFHHRAEA